MMFTITGPYNLFEKTTVYGNRLADFVQALLRIASHEWRAAVEILVPHLNRQANSIEVVRLDGTLQRFFADAPDANDDEEDYKSSDEAAFQRYFEKAGSEWGSRRGIVGVGGY